MPEMKGSLLRDTLHAFLACFHVIFWKTKTFYECGLIIGKAFFLLALRRRSPYGGWSHFVLLTQGDNPSRINFTNDDTIKDQHLLWCQQIMLIW